MSESARIKQNVTGNHWLWIFLGGIIMFVFLLIGVFFINSAIEEKQKMIESMTPAIQMLGFATSTATGTILALMLTILGLIQETQIKSKNYFYRNIEKISLLCTADFIISILILSLVTIPFSQLTTSSQLLINGLFYSLIFCNAIISGLLVTIILMIFDTVKGMIYSMKLEK